MSFILIYIVCFIFNFSWIYWTYIKYKGKISFEPSHSYRGLKMNRRFHNPKNYKNNEEFINVEKSARKTSFFVSAILSLIITLVLI
ncbi:MAG: hypothetical protein QY322_00660 [bacterium]|nr:MAG: hypothetical protein QY322_00660 [bacterium]